MAEVQAMKTAMKKVTAEADLVLKQAEIGGEMAKQEAATLLSKSKDAAASARAKAADAAFQARTGTVALVKDPKFQTITVSTAGGSIILAAAGGAFGMCSGVVVGGSAGVVPALLTFGLSIPAGAVIGGGSGLCIGATAGGAVGAAGGATTGWTVYRYRAELRDGAFTVKTRAADTVVGVKNRTVTFVLGAKTKTWDALESAQVKISTTTCDMTSRASELCNRAIRNTQEKAISAKTNVCTTVATSEFKVTAGGAVVGGTAGGATGAMAGGMAGAAVGVIPALFTFGLSIPFGFFVGAAMGGTAGTVAGGTAGAATGNLGYKHREEIGSRGAAVWSKASDSARSMKTKVKSKVLRGNTGGTVDSGTD